MVERFKANKLVDSVDKFWSEVRSDVLHDGVFHVTSSSSFVLVVHFVRTQVRSHDNQAVSKRNVSTLSIRHVAFIQQLQQDVKDIDVRFFNLIEQDDRVRLLSNRVGEHAPFVVADVAWRCANQSSHGVFFHVLGHVQTNQRLVRVEEIRC